MALKKVGTFVLTTSKVDRHGQRVLTEGVDTSFFEQNPVLFYNHIRSRPSLFGPTEKTLPIGRWQNVRKLKRSIQADAYIDMEDTFGADVARKVELGILNTASVGLHILAVSDAPEDKLPGQTDLTLTKSELREGSIVDIPANPDALLLRKSIDKSVDESGQAKEELYTIKTAFAVKAKEEKKEERPESESVDNNFHDNKNDEEMKDKNVFIELVNKVFGTQYGNAEDAKKHVEVNGLPDVGIALEANDNTAAPAKETDTETEAQAEAPATTIEAQAAPTPETVSADSQTADAEAGEAEAEKSADKKEATKQTALPQMEGFETLKSDVRAIGDLLKDLVTQVKSLDGEVKELQSNKEEKEELSEVQKNVQALSSIINEMKGTPSGTVDKGQQDAKIKTTKKDADQPIKVDGFLNDFLSGSILKN